MADCDPNSCPEKEAVCVAFNNTPSSVGACNTPDRVSPYRRTFCMETCETNKQCRENYECVDLTKKNRWSATVIQEKPEKGELVNTVCILAQSQAPIEESRSDQVCTGWIEDSSDGAGGAGGAENN